MCHHISHIQLIVDYVLKVFPRHRVVAIEFIDAVFPMTARPQLVAAGDRLKAAIDGAGRIQRYAQSDKIGVGVRKHRPVLMPANLCTSMRQFEIDLRVVKLDRSTKQVCGDVTQDRIESGFNIHRI